jgi:hypothetical protein
MPETETLGRKRHATLLKKAKELSILCDAEVAVIAFSGDGKLHEYSSTTVEHTLSRYKKKKVGLVLPSTVESDQPEERRLEMAVAKQEDQKSCDEIVDALKGQEAALRLHKRRRMGKALDELSREELCALEQEQNWALLSVMKKKEELLVGMLQRSEKENENLKRCFEERMREKPYFLQFPGNRTVFGTSSKAVSLSNCPAQDLDTSLHLGLS